ncbi:MAG: (deoxy)nucleoside triphosphate pyrophosphohydrolase [Clostridiaceae bacterium]|jgi:8-oxo-dGTP diphosphatase|nr:(deoxy)nucleoside triphosphate pyrophosphohydrolase [Bacillota bacterium]NLN52249.1 (deoxy)nucleoside triphosphate pyrophosphohydrolase [Clostridiaceae bacterium]
MSNNQKTKQDPAEVVAALIWQTDRFLICQRPPDKTLPLLYEFVGGKVDQGETREQALIRECREELAIDIEVDDVYMEVVHQYPEVLIKLILFNARISEGSGPPQMLEHVDIRWIKPSEITNFEFTPADVEILDKLRKDYLNDYQ